ncbi:uncharacterized protein LOC144154656 [Haemaphysalis longicornis]
MARFGGASQVMGITEEPVSNTETVKAANEALREVLKKNPNACDVCRKIFMAPGAILKHLKSEEHAEGLVAFYEEQRPKAIRRPKIPSRLTQECVLCNITSFKNPEAAYYHYGSPEHMERKKQLAMGGLPLPDTLAKPGTSADKQQADPKP